MHRHPTGVSSFSGTDLRKDHVSDTGVVYPLAKGDRTPSFSSIIYNNPAKLVRTEYRMATGDVAGEGIIYEKGRCVSLYTSNKQGVSVAESIFGFGTSQSVVTVERISDDKFPETSTLYDLMLGIDYEPNTCLVLETNVKSKPAVINNIPVQYGKITKKVVNAKTLEQLIKEYNSNPTRPVELLPIEALVTANQKIMYIQELERVYYGENPKMITPIEEINSWDEKECDEYIAEIIELIIDEYEEIEDEPDDLQHYAEIMTDAEISEWYNKNYDKDY
jgi:hypothetical protein